MKIRKLEMNRNNLSRMKKERERKEKCDIG